MSSRHFAVFGGTVGIFAGSLLAAYLLPGYATPMRVQDCFVVALAWAWCAEGRK